jgi:uncharacterized protein (DUF362 family)/NAD-dependent dihydropyrimidine dehydrogenase PreA subunit
MPAKSKVVLIKCENYHLEEIRAGVKIGLDLLGGAGQFAAAGEKIVIKPNMLVGDGPDKCVSPHPLVFQAVLEQFLETGARISYGDSPGFGSPKGAARQAGLLQTAEALDVPLADFTSTVTLPFPEGNLIKQFTIAKAVHEADGLISLSKLKSHALTRMTGAIKNQFGCIPGLLKPEFHTRLPHVALFSRMLVDLNLLIKPRLYIMDGIMGMEGNGPRNGTPRKMNVLLFSTDPVALDTAVCKLINLDPALVETLVYGEKFGLGSQNIEIIGDDWESLVQADFDVNREKQSTSNSESGMVGRLMRQYITPRPVIDYARCNYCGQCVRLCPAEPKALSQADGSDSVPVYDYSRCIRCYCCQELCPHEAITVKVPLLGKLIHR